MSAALASTSTTPAALAPNRRRPRLGFLGLGWIGRHRLQAIARSGVAEIVALADSAPGQAAQASPQAPGATIVKSWEDLLQADLDAVVIATPSALHAEQAAVALENGLAVFCQKPLGRNAAETARVVDAARKNDRLLGVDLSYRWVTGVRKIHELCAQREFGAIHAVDLAFHNAYGPDKPWFYDPQLSGGGCLIDLGIHLVDLALWNLGFPALERATGRLYAQGQPLSGRREVVEDYVEARLDFAGGATVRLACSWRLPAGCDAVISGSFYGGQGGAAFHNIDGSFFDFKAERYFGTRRETLACSPEEWGGRAAIDWAERLAANPGFDPEVEHLVDVARALDAIYESSES